MGWTTCELVLSYTNPGNGHPIYIYGPEPGVYAVYCSVHPMCIDGQIAFDYTGPSATRGVGVCRSSTWLCQNGSMDKITDEVLPGPRICNGLDNDCDGHPDCECTTGATKSCYDGGSWTQNIGLCKAGTQTCVGGQWSDACVGQVLPEMELCDNKDNDCDGAIDNGFECKKGQSRACYTGLPAETEGVGTCHGGKQACTNCQWSTECVGQILPEQEKCDWKDHNCNGKKNEGCDGACKDNSGKGTAGKN